MPTWFRRRVTARRAIPASPETTGEICPGGSLFYRPSWLGWLLAGLIFAVGLGVRLYDLQDPPLDFHPTRQLHSALIARGMYYESLSSAPAWQRELAVRQRQAEGVIEPQILERLSAWTYHLAGGAFLWVPRLYSILFWMAAAVLVFWLAREWAGRDGALVGALFFLAWPYAVSASRAFQPDPLMVGLIASALWAGARWERLRTWRWAAAAGLLAGLAVYSKLVAVFVVLPALAGLAVWGLGLRRAASDRQVWAMAALAVVPYLAYHVDGLYIRGFLAEQFSLRFFPSMWLDPAFYLRWASNLSRAIPVELALASLVGALLLPSRAARAALLGMWLGYAALGMALPHHISTHDYYHLPLFLPVSLGLSALAQAAFNQARGPAWLARLVSAGALLAALLLVGYEARTLLKRTDYSAQARAWEQAGELAGRGSVVVLSNDYGAGLAYWGWTMPVNWPDADDLRFRAEAGQGADFTERWDRLAEGRGFFVVSPPAELERQPDLKDYLAQRYPVVVSGPDLLVYDLRAGQSPARKP